MAFRVKGESFDRMFVQIGRPVVTTGRDGRVIEYGDEAGFGDGIFAHEFGSHLFGEHPAGSHSDDPKSIFYENTVGEQGFLKSDFINLFGGKTQSLGPPPPGQTEAFTFVGSKIIGSDKPIHEIRRAYQVRQTLPMVWVQKVKE
jgi:hypothetical protein